MTVIAARVVTRAWRRTTARAVAMTGSTRRHPLGWAAGVLVCTAVGVGVGLTVLLWDNRLPTDARDATISCLGYLVPYGVAGAFLLRRRPDLPFGWLLSAAAGLLSISLAALGLAYEALEHNVLVPGALVLAGLGSLQFASAAVQGLINVRFPSGRIETRVGRVLNRLMILGLVLVLLGGILGNSIPHAISTDLHRRLNNPITGDGRLAHAADLLAVGAPLIVLVGLIAGIRIIVLTRRATGVERRQLQWRAAGVVVSLALFPLAITEMLPAVVDFLDGSVFVATLAIPVIRDRLWEIDTVIRRSAAYVLVTVALAAAFLAITAGGAALVSERAGVIVAAFVVAVAFGPARQYGQRLVDGWFYGERNDPYRALSQVSRRLAAVAEPGTVLPAVVDSVATSLRLPYVAIERPDNPIPVAVHGHYPAAAIATLQRWPLTYQGAAVGALVASPRSGEDGFGRRDQALLSDLAHQLGAAVHADALTADLIDARQRLVNTREDERRRLRRELHDGLGPMLTGLGLYVDAARSQLTQVRSGQRDQPELTVADGHLSNVKDVSARVILDLRSIVYGLRPPALDELGLLAAVRAQAQRLSDGSGIYVEVTADDLDGLGELSAAVEVAAFRIALEALSNAIRHARATRCQIRFSPYPGGLLVEVTDDGTAAAPWDAGVGLLGMRERAAEIGGRLDAGPTAQGGSVMAWLPLQTAPPTVATP